MHETESQTGQRTAAQLFVERGDRDRGRPLVLIAGLITLVDSRGDDISLPPGRNLLGDPLPSPGKPLRRVGDEDGVGGDHLAAPWQFAHRRGLQITEDGERDGTRYRGCRHHQKVRCQTIGGLGAQAISLFDPETMLFVHHHQPESGELDRFRQQCVGADHDARLPGRDLITHLTLLRGRHRPGQQRHPGRAVLPAELTGHGQRTQNIRDRPGVLGGEDLRGRQQGALIAGIHHLQHRQHRHDGLTGSDFTL